jgi:Transposase DDE domain
MDFSLLTQVLKQLCITESFVEKYSLEIGFKKRKRKLSAFKLLLGYVTLINNDKISYSNLAAMYESVASIKISKQAIQKAINKSEFIILVKKVFEKAIYQKADAQFGKYVDIFNRILIQDSTIIRAPQNLFNYFSGVKNASTHVANSRIQLVLDLKKTKIEMFSIEPYSNNDLKVAHHLQICENDLVVRDRGYFKAKEIIRMIECRAFFILRYYAGVTYYSVDGKEIDVLALLTRFKQLDIKVRVGGANNPVVRLVAQEVPHCVAKSREEKLKKESKSKPSTRNLKFQKWTIYITNLTDKKQWPFTKLAGLYGLRWRIEIIFKVIKSFIKLSFKGLMSYPQFAGSLYLKFTWFAIILNRIYLPYCTELDISLMKLYSHVAANPTLVLQQIIKLNNKKTRQNAKDWIQKYTSYEKRTNRKNFHQQIIAFY